MSTYLLEPEVAGRRWAGPLDGRVLRVLRESPPAALALLTLVLMLMGALFAPLIAPQDAFSPAVLDLFDANTPPLAANEWTGRVFLLGTDDQGRDILSAILFGARVSFLVGFGSVLTAVVIGGSLGLLAGWRGGLLESAIMRAADVQLSIPPILMALVMFGVSRAALPGRVHDRAIVWEIILAIGLAAWPQYARMVRSLTIVEKGKEYVDASRIMGLHPVRIALRHILPNIAPPILATAALGFAVAVTAEATLSFLGAGIPPTRPSLGALIRVGQEYIAAGQWWILAFPSIALMALALSVNVVGDWLRQFLNPRLQ